MNVRASYLSRLLLLVFLCHLSVAWSAPRNVMTAEAEFVQQGAVGPFDIDDWGQEIISPTDLASGQTTGKRQHKPFVIRKRIDAASPMLYQALINNEVVSSLTVHVYKQSKSPKALAFTIKLTNARVIRTTKDAAVATHADASDQEKFEFVYQTIEWTDVKSGTVTTDNWRDQS